jgi:hypothetical protein
MHERETGQEKISKGELFFLCHPGNETIFSGYGLTMEEGSKARLVGLLMVDRPWPADPKWLRQVNNSFGEYQLVPMTVIGERGIICRMQIEPESLHHLQQLSTEKATAIKTALHPLLEEPPKPIFTLRWNEDKKLWQSQIVSLDKLS